jgi:DNA polymerase-3 subunit alpha
MTKKADEKPRKLFGHKYAPEKHGIESYNIHDLEAAKKAAKKKLVVTSGKMEFASLHHHSTFSYLDGFGMPEKHVERAAELGMPAMAMTEHGNMSSHPRFERAAISAGIKPVFGLEAYCGSVDEERTQRKNHLTLLAEDNEGYRNLLRLVERSYSEGFYYEATINGEMLAEHKKGLVVLSGCLGSLLATSIVGGKNVPEDEASLKQGEKVAQRFHRVFGDRYFLEVQAFPELPKSCTVNQAVEHISRKYGIPLIATNDVHYSTPKEGEMQQILHNVRGGARQTLEQQAQAWGYDVELCHPGGHEIVYKRLRATGLSKKAALEAIANTLIVADLCSVQLPKSPKLRFPVPYKGDAKEMWREWLREGWFFRRCHKLPKKEKKRYAERVKYERGLIEDKDFYDYFLIVSDAVRWAKDHGIPVGPARGSAAGSLVCWLLRITEVNPMLFPNLIFERFIDAKREDEPDIDLDFDDGRRDEVRQYLIDKYGEKYVANLGTFTYFKSKNSLDDLARVYRVPQWEVDKIKNMLIERSSADLRANATIQDTAEMFSEVKEVFDEHPELYKAMDLEGNVKGMGVHAAGIVVSNQDTPIRDIVPIHRRVLHGREIGVVAMDKYDAELMGLLKMDFLGLKTMGLIGVAIGYIGMSLKELYEVPLDDPKTTQGFQENDVVGIFQFDGQATKDIASIIRPSNFAEVYHTNAMSRPGPLHNGATANYINIKNGLEKRQKLHPIYDNITKDTQGQLIYQEQILRIVTEMGNFDWTHVAYIRRLISKKMGEQEFNNQKKMFMEGAEENGVKIETAEKIWRMCITAGAYAFNAAHAVSYGMNAWYTMWLKRHYPREFFSAALQKYQAKETKLLRDAVMPPPGVNRAPLKVYPPHPRKSLVTWKPVPRGVRAGFVQIPGIGEKTAAAMVEVRDIYSEKKFHWGDFVIARGIGPVTMQKVQEFVNKDDPFNVTKLHRELEIVRQALRKGKLGSLPVPTHRSSDIPYEAGEDHHVIWCGVVLKRNLRDLFEYHLSKKGEELDPDTVKRPDLREWVVMRCEDEEEVVYVTFNRYDYSGFKDAIWNIELERDVILVRGIKRSFLNKRDILVKEMWVIEE